MANYYVCRNCKRAYEINELWYDPYKKIRYCKDCYEQVYQRKINECVKVERIENWLEEEN